MGGLCIEDKRKVSKRKSFCLFSLTTGGDHRLSEGRISEDQSQIFIENIKSATEIKRLEMTKFCCTSSSIIWQKPFMVSK